MTNQRLTLSIEETLNQLKKIKHIIIEEDTNISTLFERLYKSYC